MSIFKFKPLAVFLVFGGLVAAAQAEENGGTRVAPLPKYRQECAACHLAYPAGMLPAASWKRIMGSLNKHYGADASLPDADVREIGAWLNANAGTYKRVSGAPPEDRLSKSEWFLRKHRAGEVPADVWKRPAIGSASNCTACHTQAANGSFSEREIRIPK
jgi:hypothetical protein